MKKIYLHFYDEMFLMKNILFKYLFIKKDRYEKGKSYRTKVVVSISQVIEEIIRNFILYNIYNAKEIYARNHILYLENRFFQKKYSWRNFQLDIAIDEPVELLNLNLLEEDRNIINKIMLGIYYKAEDKLAEILGEGYDKFLLSIKIPISLFHIEITILGSIEEFRYQEALNCIKEEVANA